MGLSNDKVNSSKAGGDSTTGNNNDGLTRVGNAFVKNLIGGTGLGGKLSRLQGLLSGGKKDEGGSEPVTQTFSFTKAKMGEDPRVKIKIPEKYLDGPAKHIQQTQDGGIVFPYTPQIVVQTRANYNNLNPTHSNYTYYAYQNSALDAISIVGTFSAQNPDDARYMLGAIHALRAVTKMNFGGGTGAGAPPPVCRLSGYGKYQFNNLPIVISSFFYTLNEDVDYISIDPNTSNSDWTAVPTRAEFTIECLPAFSRRDQAMFNIDKFVSGDLTKTKGMI